MEIEIDITAHVLMRLKVETTTNVNYVTRVDSMLEVDSKDVIIKPEMYFGKGGEPTAAGVMLSTNALIEGLNGNIHYAHNKGYRDSAEHLRYIIDQLERRFVAIVTTEPGIWKEDN